MQDKGKTKEQLIIELNEMRREFAEFKSVSANIADLRRTEEALKQSERNYNVIFERSPLGMMRFNSDGIVTDCNQAFLNVTGATRDQVIDFNLLVSLANEEVKKAVRSALSGNIGKYTGEYTSVTGNLTAWLDIIYLPVTTEDGVVTEGIAIVQDMTARKKTEKALWESEEMMNSILAASPIGIGFTAFNRTILWANQAWLNLFGFEDKKQFLGQSTLNLYPSVEEFERVKDATFPFVEKGMVGETDVKMIRRNGEIFDAHIRLSPLDPLDPSKGLISAIEDVSARKRAEKEKDALQAQLAQSQKMEAIGTLVGGLAHDFNNMLQIILGYTQLIMMEKDESHEDYPDLESIVRTVKDGAELVNKLLMFGREAPIRPVLIDLNQQIEGLMILMSHTVPKMVNIQFNLTDEPTTIHVDPTQIDQVVLNLAQNASEAMPDGGQLTIQTGKEVLENESVRNAQRIKAGAYVALSVSDTGSGMDAETLSRIFEPFFSTKEKSSTRGSGLGLSVVKGIVEQHGGHITCESELGKGTEIKLYFPAVEARQKSVKKTRPKSRPGHNGTILVVDDELSIIDQARRFLSNAGYKVITAKDGKEALDIYRDRREEISLVILDLLMPVMSGNDCLKELTKINPSVKAMISSGFSPDSFLEEEIGRLAKGFVHKPYDVTRLLLAIECALNGN
jgi:two-component system cell cycle sensor histidine kinase/response regulator CckA